MKTVRLRVSSARRLLLDEGTPNLKAVVLVRDPRGVMTSRARMDWCTGAPCADAATACADLADDVRAARKLEGEFPGRVVLLRYEDLSLVTTCFMFASNFGWLFYDFFYKKCCTFANWSLSL